jgi:hypothetical protein
MHPSVIAAGIPAILFLARYVKGGGRKFVGLAPCAIVAVSSLCTPDGFKLFSVAAYNAHVSRDVLLISEWMPPWNRTVFNAMEGFWLCFLVSIPMVIVTRRRQDPWELLQAGIFVGFVLFSARFAPYWGICMVPLWRRGFDALFPTVVRRISPYVESGLGHPVSAVAAVLVALVPTGVREIQPNSPAGSEGAYALARVRPTARVYNFYAAAGPLVYFGSDRFTLHVDGRLYLFSEAFWRQYGREARGDVPLEDMLTKYQPDAFYLWKPFQGALSSLLAADPRFQRVFEDASDVVYVRGEGP